MKVFVFTRQTIIPSSPTPSHLRHVQLSFLDQINNPVFMPMVYFYPSEPGTNDIRVKTLERTDRLKSSLSEILSRFYPLAGRAKEDRFIECNDTGVYYTEAEAKCQLSQFLAQPDPAKLNKLLPCELEDSGDLLLAIQVNIFDCGGIGIGVCFSHIIMDAISIVTFMNSWAAVGRGDRCNAVLPSFNLASLFPHKDILSNFNRKVGIAKEKIVTKRFVFTDSAISALRAKYAAKPTRVEALSTFIWSRYVVATRGVANTPRYLLSEILRF